MQRVPVRIALDAQELATHPLRVGLSMEAKVDVRDTSGRMLADGTRAPTPVQTDVFAAAATPPTRACAASSPTTAAGCGKGPQLAPTPPVHMAAGSCRGDRRHAPQVKRCARR